MKWGNSVTYSSEHEKEKGGILTTSGDKYEIGEQKLTQECGLNQQNCEVIY